MPEDEAKKIGTNLRESQELYKREVKLIQDIAERGPATAKFIIENSSINKEMLDKIPHNEWEKIYKDNAEQAKKANTPQKESTLEKFKENVKDLASRTRNFIADKVKSIGNTVESIDKLAWAVGNALHEKVKAKIQELKPKSQSKGSGHSR
ncbi:MAG TPA: hypothetical protein LFW21_05585 [Rickettsia endosymbiont of Pyrocoelia pectoralis]|nr:hypothetical protein [Rickettsia endosymbiont of Pyrocoelia pectoralis]